MSMITPFLSLRILEATLVVKNLLDRFSLGWTKVENRLELK